MTGIRADMHKSWIAHVYQLVGIIGPLDNAKYKRIEKKPA